MQPEKNPYIETESDVSVDEIIKAIPHYNVILLDDNEHTYEYVIEMLMKIFGHSLQTAFEMAVEVDTRKRVIVYTTYKERALQKKREIESYGADWRIPNCKGSMSAIIEKVN